MSFSRVLQQRFTAKWWRDDSIPTAAAQEILACAYHAPSKQGNYNYTIVALTDTDKGRELKSWLYYNDTTCLDRVQGLEGTGARRYNGQVQAPLVLVWLAHTPWATAEVNDCHVSATMAMAGAELAGVQTGFCGCLGAETTAAHLGYPQHRAVVSVGFGYADTDSQVMRTVEHNGVELGFDLSNTDPRIRNTPTRRNKPSKNKLIRFV